MTTAPTTVRATTAGADGAPGAEVPPSTFGLGVGALLEKQVRARPDAVAVRQGDEAWTYRELNRRVNRLASFLAGLGVGRGDRVAVLSENRHEYLELELAAAKLGAIVACQNWRLADAELTHCVRLTSPSVLVVSPRYAETAGRIDHGVAEAVVLGDDLEARLTGLPDADPPPVAEPEDGLVILYTSGTTGLPKGAVISHRALVARASVYCVVTGSTAGDAFLAWAPMFHMASTDQSLITFLLGGTVVVTDGLDLDALVESVERERLGWLIAMPGMIEGLIERLGRGDVDVVGVKMVGAMADLVPRHQIAELTRLLDAPYLNTFGSTEAGLAPACASTLAPGEVPTSLAKRESPFCDVRLVGPDDDDVPDGTPGECLVRGPTLFSGYWNAPKTNAEDFRGGWFHTGDVMVRNPDGSLDFVDRVKYLIKTGGENVYPAEIEQVLLAHPRVRDAVVVRRPDDRWGEVPVAFVARGDEPVEADELLAHLRERLARYKLPKEVRFVEESDLPRSTTGKIQRHEVEKWL